MSHEQVIFSPDLYVYDAESTCYVCHLSWSYEPPLPGIFLSRDWDAQTDERWLHETWPDEDGTIPPVVVAETYRRQPNGEA